jgi:DNA repair exonuclease SbcCD ATPase subunit
MIIEDDVKVPVSLASGFQKFILDMLIRVSLAEMPNTPHTNLMFVDEGFGSLDRENFI